MSQHSPSVEVPVSSVSPPSVRFTRSESLRSTKWWHRLGDLERDLVLESLPAEISPLQRIHLYYANFILDTQCIYLAGEPVGDIPTPILQSIQLVCAEHMFFVPMIMCNLRFLTDCTVHTPRPLLPDLTFRNVFSGQIIGYREKIDGALVWRTPVSFRGVRYDMHVGAISMPAFIQVDTFEMDGLSAYSISPFNVETKVHYGFAEVTFISRPVFPRVDPEWVDGAVALLWQDGKAVEKRVKRVQSSELEFLSGRVTLGGVDHYLSHPVTNLPLDGVYECVLADGSLFPCAYRPFKTHDPQFLTKMNFPDILQAPKLNFAYRESPLGFGVSGDIINVPLSELLPHSFVDPVISDKSVIAQVFDERGNAVRAATYLDGDRVTFLLGSGSNRQEFQMSVKLSDAANSISFFGKTLRVRFSIAEGTLEYHGHTVTRTKDGAVGMLAGTPIYFEPSRMQGVHHLVLSMTESEFHRVFLPQNLAKLEGGKWSAVRVPVSAVNRLKGNEFYPPSTPSTSAYPSGSPAPVVPDAPPDPGSHAGGLGAVSSGGGDCPDSSSSSKRKNRRKAKPSQSDSTNGW